MLVAEGHRFEREDRFARFVHRFDSVLETRRGDDRAEVAVGVDNYPDPPCHRYPINAGDIGVFVSSFCADADLGQVARETAVADIDIVTASGESATGARAQPDVVATGFITKEGIKTAGRVVTAACVAKECLQAIGRVVVAVDVAVERPQPPVAVFQMPVVLL